jgi:ATP-dependent DNA helicase RecQ
LPSRKTRGLMGTKKARSRVRSLTLRADPVQKAAFARSRVVLLAGSAEFRRDQWRAAAIDRCQRALANAHSLADRLTLIRSLARLQDGRVLVPEDVQPLSPDELVAMPRFDLATTSNGAAIRLVDTQDPLAPDEFAEAIRLDSAPRAAFKGGTPDAILLRHSAHQAYRTPAQKAAIRALMTMPPGSGLMVCMPTGCGKSLLFQLYPEFLRTRIPGACVAVVTPTVALAHDHARTLATIPGLEHSRAITGDLSSSEREDVLGAFRRGEIPVLLLSPEFALGAARDALVEAATPLHQKYDGLNAQLKALFIDEAHIVESWGRSFRPDFQRLPALLTDLRQRDPSVVVICLSATLTPAARQELTRAYGAAGSWLEIDAQTPRYEFDIVSQCYSDERVRDEALDHVIDRAPRPLIVYTTRVEDADALHQRLKARGYGRLALFTGETAGSARGRIVDEWAADRLDLVVATSAFGMGIDKSDVRSVVHACLPESPSRWYQEIGRAARDGHQGLSVSLFTNTDSPGGRSDRSDAYAQATGSWLTRELAERRWRALVSEPVDSRWEGGLRLLTLDLDAAHDGLSTSKPTDHNRNWNRSLLNLLQRARILTVVSVLAEPGDARALWQVEIEEPSVLDPKETTIWDRIFDVRNQEQSTARSEFNAFAHLMQRPTQRCLLQAVFGLIEGEVEHFVPACGRCPSCRKLRLPPPSEIRLHGLETAWPGSELLPAMRLPKGVTLIAPDDPSFGFGLSKLLQRLVGAGFDQFITPRDIAADAAARLAQTPARLGLVLSQDEWVGDPSRSLSKIPTAILLPPEQSAAVALLRRVHELGQAARDLPVVILGRPERQIHGRRLDQTVSTHAPYAETWLDGLRSTEGVLP